MNIRMFAFSVMVLAALSLQAASVSAQSISEIGLLLTKQTPYPAQPGDVVSIEVALQNNGSSSQSITLQINPSAPFTLLPGEEKVKTFTSIGALSVVKQTYRLKLADTAPSSEYNIEFKYYKEGVGAEVIKKLPITVSGTPKIIIEGVETDPATVEPGNEVELDVKLLNAGRGKASNIELALVAEADPTTGESLIVPVLSGGSAYIDELLPGEEKIARFKMDIANDAEYKTYLSTLSVLYKDESGQSGSVTYDVGIPVKGSPAIEILSAKVEGSDFKVDIENIGTGSAKALKIEFVQDGEVKDSSVASELKPTRHKTLRFSGFNYGNAYINISYLDESNRFFSEDTLVTVKMPYSSENTGSTDMTGAVGLLVLLVLAEGYYIWRLRKRLKKR